MTQEVFVPGRGFVTLHFNNWLARLPGGINNCITINSRRILVSRDWVTAQGLAHEYGHILQAKRLGWRYIPWVLWHYLTSGYANSLPEQDADAYMTAYWPEFPSVGKVPTWVAPPRTERV